MLDKQGCIIFKDYPEFRPNMTPREIFQAGSFGGTYWRPIKSGVTNKTYQNVYKKYSFLKKIPANLMTKPFDEYDKKINKYNVKVGTTLEFWESKDWIKMSHPYGWVHWYCDFYSGKRGPDDRRQIDRWLGLAGPRGRFKRRIVNMIKKKNTKWNDYSVSPAIRQTLQHWAYRISKHDV